MANYYYDLPPFLIKHPEHPQRNAIQMTYFHIINGEITTHFLLSKA
jgi:hypothetical protein